MATLFSEECHCFFPEVMADPELSASAWLCDRTTLHAINLGKHLNAELKAWYPQCHFCTMSNCTQLNYCKVGVLYVLDNLGNNRTENTQLHICCILCTRVKSCHFWYLGCAS